MRDLRHAIPVAAVALCAWAVPADAAKLAISCGAVGAELQVCREGVEAWAKKTGHEVQIVSTPNSATERLALYQQILAARSGDIDVFQIDVIWPGILGSNFVDLTPLIPARDVAEHFPTMIANNTIGGKLVAMPWFTDAGLLYYRKDLLAKHGHKPPTTWQDLATVAADVQAKERAAGNDRMWGYVFQGKAYEGLTCNALEWVDSFGGGTIVATDGKITIDNAKAAAAVGWAAATIGKIAPEGVLNYAEEEARGVFQSGNAVFMRNWPYAWSLAQAPDSAIRDKVGVAALPKGGAEGKHTGALGGWELAVSAYSQNKDLAVELVRYLTSKEEQKRRAIAGSFNPTIPALYKDQQVLAASPFMGELYDTFVNAVARPSRVTGGRYNQVSAEFFGAVHEALGGQAKPEAAVAQVAQRLDRLSRGGRW